MKNLQMFTIIFSFKSRLHINYLLFLDAIAQASRAESIECKNEMDPFPHLIYLIFTEQMYLY